MSVITAKAGWEPAYDVCLATDSKTADLKQQKEAGFFTKSRMSYLYRVEVNNFRHDDITVTVQDQMPLAGDAEIKVTLDEPSIYPDEIKDDDHLSWNLPMKAGDKRE